MSVKARMEAVARPNFPAMEEEVLQEWEEKRVFEQTLEASKDRPVFSFYDGPPFATGLPHYGHILAGTIKDAVCRYAHQTGYHVPRRFGWDCHGLPIEYEIDKKFEIRGRQDILDLGIATYNEECRSIVDRFAGEWETIVKRFGRWIDFKNDYKTMDLNFMESVWWVMRQLFDKGMVYRSFRVMPVSTACNTPLSNFEVAQNYKDVSDPSVLVKLSVQQPSEALAAALATNSTTPLFVVVWTTTPWTLPSNQGACVHPAFRYKVVEVSAGDARELWVVGGSRLEWVKSECKKHRKGMFSGFKEIAELSGAEVKGTKYAPLFPYFEASQSDAAYRVMADEYVTDATGTGVVHQAPGFGEDDFRVCVAHGVVEADGSRLCLPVTLSGTYTADVPDYEGQHVKAADKALVQRLKDEGKLVCVSYESHSYPHCWRSDTPLIYMAIPAWFVKVEEVRDRLVENNKKSRWVPAHVQEKRFHNWLCEARDWCVSRNRFWGTPLPIWVSDDFQEVVCIGSVAELQQYAPEGEVVTDLHRHNIDHIKIPSKQGKGMLSRVDEVFDCWFESGSMPYGQQHYPFENKESFDAQFPADFIAEGLDQTRGWFYTLNVLSTHLRDEPPFKNLVVNGLVLAEDGKKMSKRLKNYPDPVEVVHRHGADAVRVYMLNSQVVRGEPLRFSESGVAGVVREVLLPWYSSFKFLATQVDRLESREGADFAAILAQWREEKTRAQTVGELGILDLYVLSECNALLANTRQEMDNYRLYAVVPRLLDFLEKLTNVYIRLNRDRMRDSETAAVPLCVLFDVLLRVTVMLAPIAPFTSEIIYRQLSKQLGESERRLSVHMVQIPEAPFAVDDAAGARVAHAMSLLQRAVELGRGVRHDEGRSVKEPAGGAKVYVQEAADVAALEDLSKYLKEELNCDELEVHDFTAGHVTFNYRATLNFRLLGPLVGKQLPAVKKFFDSQVTQAQLASMADGASVEVPGVMKPARDGQAPAPLTLTNQDVEITREVTGLEGSAKAADGVAIVLDLSMSEERRRRWAAREAGAGLQRLRKAAGLAVTDKADMFVVPRDEEALAILDAKLVTAHVRHEVVQAGADVLELLDKYEAAPGPESAALHDLHKKLNTACGEEALPLLEPRVDKLLLCGVHPVSLLVRRREE